ncbi:MAG TPA: hypothetical protein VK524_24505, partial [Polyangiaceae bacterium]|nr:hypothetical protein [Polyangiaceae bacterium]
MNRLSSFSGLPIFVLSIAAGCSGGISGDDDGRAGSGAGGSSGTGATSGNGGESASGGSSGSSNG